MARDLRIVLVVTGIVFLACVPLYAWYYDTGFYLTLFGRIMVFATAAVSLGLILGYGGMYSFGHAAYLGLGAYTIGILAHHDILNGPVQWLTAVVVCALGAFLIGAVSLRTRGLYFIMITLAFSQMLFFFFVSLDEYGGDDGLTIWFRSDFTPVLDLTNRYVLYYVMLGLLVLSAWLAARLVESRFGMVIRGAMSNEARMEALGFPIYRYRLTAFVLAAIICGIAGVLLATLTDFVSPSYLHWVRSAELMFMVILGGMGSIAGPAFGAGAYLLLQEVLAEHTEYWHGILGPILILIILFARRGIWGLFEPVEGDVARRLPSGALAAAGPRIAAFAIDLAVVVALGWVALALVEGAGHDLLALTGRTLAYAAIPVVYFVLSWTSRWQATPGMRVMGLRVTAEDGSPLAPRQALQRLVALALSTAILGLGHLPALWREDRATLQDVLARTRVIRGGWNG